MKFSKDVHMNSSRTPGGLFRRRQGFTLIELMAVVAIIGIVAVLVLGAVQQAREAARRIQCSNNLKQFGIAINSYGNATGVFPRGEHGYSPHVMMLPYLEQAPLYHSINLSLHPSDMSAFFANQTAARVTLSLLLCPSDGIGPSGMASTSYATNHGVGFDPSGPKRNGPFSWSTDPNRPVSLQSVTDGFSNTAAMAEWIIGIEAFPGERSPHPLRRTFETSQNYREESEFPLFVHSCRNMNHSTASDGVPSKGENWLELGLGRTGYNHALTPNHFSCTNSSSPLFGAWTAGSWHASGANVLFLDGHVSFKKDTITEDAWRAIGTMNGNEVIND